MLGSVAVKAQNYGFEATAATPPANWTVTTGTWVTNTTATYVRTGLQSMAITSGAATSGTTVQNTSPIVTVPSSGTNYVIAIGWVKASTNGNGGIVLGYRTGTTNTLPTTTSTTTSNSNSTSWTRVTYTPTAAATNGSTYSPAARAWRNTTSTTTDHYLDDVIVYTSTSATPDLTAPNAAAGASLAGNQLSWTNGTDNGSPASGIGGVVILRADGAGQTAPTLNDQAMYDPVNGAAGVGSFVNSGVTWKVVGNINNGTTTTFTDASAGAGPYTYAIYMRDMAYNYSPAVTLQSSPCVSPPIPGTSTVSPAAIQCAGVARTLNLSGASAGVGQTYRWLVSSTQAGTYTYVSASSASPTLLINPTTTQWYKAEITCSGNTQESVPVEVLVNTSSYSGTFDVGAGGTYTTLTAAINAYNNACALSGPVVYRLTNTTYTTGETFPLIINAQSTASATNTLTIKPATGITAVISGSVASGALINLNGADYVTIDGSNSGATDRSLTITNTNATSPTAISLSSAGAGSGATNNTFKNLIITTSASGAGYGISAEGGTQVSNGADNDDLTIQNNLISGVSVGIYAIGTAAVNAGGLNNLIIDNNTITTATTVASLGIQVGNAINASVSQNDISVETSAASSPVGISLETGFVSSVVTRNLIRKVIVTNTGGWGARGITIGTGTATSDLTITNNVISRVNGTNFTGFGNSSSMGIAIGIVGNSATLTTTTGGIKLYHNSVYLSGEYETSTSTTANKITAALFVGSAATALDIRNNVFSNALNNSNAVAKAYAVYSAAASSAYTTINYNDYYVSGSQGVLAYLTSDRADIAAWRTATGQDVNSISSNPLFNGPTNLIPQPGSPLSGAGTGIATVTIDVNGVTRSASTPAIGAYETTIDLAPPAVSFTPLATICNTNDRTFTATIVDGTGVPTTGSLVPRVWYRKGTTGAWSSTAGVFTSGTATNGTWSFTIESANLPGLQAGDNVYYYIMAQDVASTPNVGSTPSGAVATDVLTVTTPPATANSYLVAASLGGSYNIGSGGAYTTLTQALSMYKTACLTGAVIFNLTDATYSTAETFPIVIDGNANASAVNTLTIKPASGNSATISGGVASGALIKINGADYITIDGSNNGGADRSLTVTNTDATSPAGVAIVSLGAGLGATNNTIKNLVINTSSTGAAYGITVGGATNASSGADNDNTTIQNNYITGVSVGIYSSGTASATSGGNDNLNIDGNLIDINTAVTGNIGIQVANSLNSVISRNDISVETSTTGAQVGISLETGFVSSTVTRNIIRKVVALATGGYGGRGITVGTGTATSDLTISNNVIFGINGSNWTTFGNSSSMGIAIGMVGNSTTITTTAGGIKIYNNSVNLYGDYASTSATANKITAALYVGSGASALDIRNNVFSNSLNNPAAAAKAYAIYSAASNSAFTTIDYNDYFVSGTQGVLAFLSSDRADIAAWRTATTKDVNSVNVNPNFNSNTVLVPQAGSALVGAGQSIAAVTIDFKGTARNNPPTIGAYENAGDGLAPVITYTALPFTCATGDRILSGVTITDGTGVPTTGSLVPRIYYRKGNGTWFSQPGTLTSGTATNGTWSFQIIAADMGGLAVGNHVSYYIVAQDIVATPNIGSSPSGVTATDVNTIVTVPNAVNTYAINTTLNGNYNVGGGGAYTTITAALADYNVACLTGPITFTLTDAGYNTNETFPLVIESNPYASSVNTLTITPAANTSVLVKGTSGTTASALIKLNGADYVTIDGIHDAAGTNLIIENTSVTGGTAAIWLASLGAGQGATNNTIKNVTLKGGADQNTNTTTTYGVVIAGSSLNATITSVTAGEDNDNNTIDTCTISKVRYGIYVRGGSAANPNSGTIISRNVIGSTGFGVDEIGKAGIVVREEDGIQIRNNEIRYVGGDFSNNSASSATARAGIAFATDATWTPTSAYVKNARVTSNIIHDIQDEKVGAAIGIIVAGADGTNATNNIISSNFIYNIKANGTTSPNQAVGIGIAAGNGDKVAFNSIYMSGNANGSTGATAATVPSFGIRISSTNASNVSILNNIVYMDLIAGAASLKNFCIDIPTGYTWGTGNMDYNDWFANPANAQSGTGSINNGAAATQYLTLAAWQSASGKDANSKEVDPQFISPSDLHLQPSSPLDGQGTPVTGITTDIDNQLRDVATPDIGADELPPAAGLDVKPQDLVAPVVTAKGCYTAAETVTVSIKNNGSSTINFAGTPVTVNVSVNGAATFTYPSKLINSGTLAPGAVLNVPISTTGTELDMSAPGVYLFDITTSAAGDVNTANDALQESRTVEALTVGVASASPADYCAVGGKPVLTTTNANGYSSLQWMESTTSGSGFTPIAGATTPTFTVPANITQTMFYKLVATCGANTDESGESVVVLNNYQPLTTTPATRCGVGTVNLGATADAGLLINWYANPTGGTPLATGTSFTTPTINTTTNYYVGVGTGTTTPTGMATVTSSPTSGAGTTNFGIVFDALSAFTLKSVTIYPVSASNAAGTVTIDVINSAGTVVHTKTVNVVGSPAASPQPHVVTLDFNIAPGTNYKLRPGSYTGISGLLFEPSAGAPSGNYGYPYIIPSVLQINTSTLTAAPTNTARNDLYYYFYNWQVSTGCEGVRVPVTATVTTPPTLSITPNNVVCNGVTKLLEVTSATTDFDSYIWSPAANLYTDAAATIPYTGTSATQVYVKGVAGTYNYTLTATNTVTNCVNTTNSTITVQPASVTIAASLSDICISGTSTLTANPAAGYGANSLQWQSSPDGVAPYTDIAGANNATYTTPTLTATTFYKLLVKDGTGAACLSPTKTIVVNNPQITGTTPATRCGTGTVTLGATATGGTINWYSSATGGSPISTGTSYTTPAISANTTYYVSASSGSNTSHVGRLAPQAGAATNLDTYGQDFTLTQQVTLNSVEVISTTGTSITVSLYNAAGTTQLQTTGAITVPTNATSTINLGWTLAPGTYRLAANAMTGNFIRENSTVTYPIALGTIGQINGFVSSLAGTVTTTASYYWFYNLSVTVGCETSRTPVLATVTAGPALTVTANKTICNNSIHQLSVTSTLSDFDSYVWSPVTGLFTDVAATIPYTGGSATDVYVKTTSAGAATYTVTATNTVSGCGNVATSVVTVLPNPTIVASGEICVSGTTTLSLSPASGYGTATYQWLSSPDGVAPYANIPGATNPTYTTPSLTQNGYYSIVLKDGGGTACAPSFGTAIVNNPLVTGTAPGSRCGTGSVTLGATGSAGTTLKWYTTSTGGSSIGTGSTFTTPSISTNTTYYVSAAAGGGGTASAGLQNAISTSGYTLEAGLFFNAVSNFTLQGVYVYPMGTGAGTATIALQNSAGTTLQSVVANLTGTAAPYVKTYVPLNFNIPVGTDYRLVMLTRTGLVSGLIRESGAGWGSYPLTVPGVLSIVNGKCCPDAVSTSYYYFYDWLVTAGCESSRTAVLATVNPTASNAAGALGTTECDTRTIAATTEFSFTDCDLIGKIAPTGVAPISGSVDMCVKIDNTVQTAPSGEPYVQRHYNITPLTNATTATSNVTLVFLQSEFDAFNLVRGTYAALPTSPSDVAGISNLRITQYNGTGTAPGNYTGTASIIDPVDANISWNSTLSRWEVTFAATGSGGFYVHSSSFILPVTITNFRGEAAGSINKLYWSTSTETNNNGFELQRSADGINYNKITFVATKANGGNSTSQLSYNFDDMKPLPGINYYRLKQIDNNGKFSYSGVVTLSRRSTEITLSKVFPNPATTELNVVITSPRAEKLTIIVTDLRGKVVMQTSTNVVLGENQQQLNVAKLAGGTYMVKVICADGCETAVHRFVKQ